MKVIFKVILKVILKVISKVIFKVISKFILWLYSDRTEHFCGRGAQILTKLFEGVPYMEKMISSPSEPFLVIRVCQKCQKTKKHEKTDFWGNFGYISKMVKSIFMIFWDKTPLSNTWRLGKKISPKLASFLRKNQLYKTWNFSKTRLLIFIKFKT